MCNNNSVAKTAARNSVGPDTSSNPLYWFSSMIFPIFMLLALFLLFCLLPTLAVAVRRLRDAGYHPWIIIIPVLLLIGSYHPALVIALSGMDSTPPEIPLPYCYAYLTVTALVCSRTRRKWQCICAASLCRNV